MNKKRLTVIIPKEYHDALTRITEETGALKTELVCQALRELGKTKVNNADFLLASEQQGSPERVKKFRKRVEREKELWDFFCGEYETEAMMALEESK